MRPRAEFHFLIESREAGRTIRHCSGTSIYGERQGALIVGLATIPFQA